MTPARYARLRAILDRRQPDLTVLMDDLQKPHNVSAVIRTCDAVGVPRIHAVSDAPSFKTRRSSAGGTGRYVGVRLHATTGEAIDHLHGRGFRVVGELVEERAPHRRAAPLGLAEQLVEIGQELHAEPERLARDGLDAPAEAPRLLAAGRPHRVGAREGIERA